MKIELKNLTKEFDGQRAVENVSLSIQEGEFFFLLGPSGCGKTTLLRLLAGFYEPDSGTIHFGDRLMNHVPPQDRNTALVFQNYALWPHLTVFENVAYGLRLRGVKEPELTQRVDQALQQVAMTALKARRPNTLSGGQQQRVALARAIVVRPDVLLFDEPLSNLDAQLRLQMREEIGRLHRETGITSIYVTHDQEEALSLADRIAVLDRGTVQQVGTPIEVYNKPINRFVAQFLGEINFLPSEKGEIGFRPERVVLLPAGQGHSAQVLRTAYFGSRNQLTLRTAEGIEIKAWSADPIAPGTAVGFTIPPEHMLSLP